MTSPAEVSPERLLTPSTSIVESIGHPQSVVVLANGDAVERERWKTALEAAGHGVIEAPTMLMLLELASAEQPDLVLCAATEGQDGEGELDAFEALRSIRENGATAKVPCVLTSKDAGEWRRAMARGADDFLSTPVDEKMLLEAVEARLERQRTLNELARRNAFQNFPAELLELVVRKTPVAEVLQRVSEELQKGIGAIAVVPRLSHGDQLETIQARGLSPRSWSELDRLIGKLLVDSVDSPNPARKELVTSLSSSLLLLFVSQKINPKPSTLWHVPIRSEDGGLMGSFEIFLGSTDSIRWVSGVNRAALDPVFRLAGVLMERQHLFDELTRQTHFDSVTGLPNRKEFERHLQEAHRRGEELGKSFAVICLDIDRFQRINDTYGYDVADRLLADVAARLRLQSRGQDLVARISGDEFAILVPDSPDRGQLQRLAGRLTETLSQPYLLHQHRIVINITAGVALYPDDSPHALEVLPRAEMALASARRAAHKSGLMMDRREPSAMIDGVDVESYLERALAVNGFVLHYQPIYRNRGGCCGFEALVRLRRGLLDPVPPEKGILVPPAVFLPVAEDSGLIVPMGAWVFDEACRQLRQWSDSGFPCPHIAVNLSARQLGHSGLVETFAASIAKHQVEVSRIEIELTETAIIGDYQSGKRRLEELKQLGLRIAIDDFGIGYSSLSYLNNFPADKIKIDQSFVRRLGVSSSEGGSENTGVARVASPNGRSDPSLPVIGAILSIASSLGAEVVAEGVETSEQYRILSEAGCHEFQGYLFARPMGAVQVVQFMNQHRGWTADWFAAQSSASVEDGFEPAPSSRTE